MNMKNGFLYVLLFFFFWVSSGNSQDRNHELGIRLTDITDFGFIYKKSDDGVKFKRYRVALANLNLAFNDDVDVAVGLEASFARGIEKRKNIAKNLQFIYGWEPGIYMNFQLVDEGFDTGFGGFLGYVLGFQYNFSPQFYVNIETIPSFSVIGRIDDNDNFSFNTNIGFNSNAIALTMAYAFTTPKP